MFRTMKAQRHQEKVLTQSLGYYHNYASSSRTVTTGRSPTSGVWYDLHSEVQCCWILLGMSDMYPGSECTPANIALTLYKRRFECHAVQRSMQIPFCSLEIWRSNDPFRIWNNWSLPFSRTTCETILDKEQNCSCKFKQLHSIESCKRMLKEIPHKLQSNLKNWASATAQ